jgi:hypothetical protein
MKTIWKYKLPVLDEFHVDIPAGARILTAQVQHNELNLWALVDTEATVIPYNFAILGTGNPIDDSINLLCYRFVNTFQLYEGGFVGHLFQVLSDDNQEA